MANPQLTMFGTNIWFLVGALILGSFLLLVLFATWTGIKVALFRREQRRAGEAYRKQRYREDGSALPPTSRGICDVCGAVSTTVYHLEDGRRVCESDYPQHTRRTKTAYRNPRRESGALPGKR